MPRGLKGERRPADVIGNAVHVMRVLTGEIEETPPVQDKEHTRRVLWPSFLHKKRALCGSRDHRKEGFDCQNMIEPLSSNCIQVPQPYNTDRAVRRGCCASDPWRATLSVRSNLDFGSDNRRARPLCAPCAY